MVLLKSLSTHLKRGLLNNLHSNMVLLKLFFCNLISYTFSTIYIPIWCYLNYFPSFSEEVKQANLHSNMVLLKSLNFLGLALLLLIYIPIWCYLNNIANSCIVSINTHLHSNMVLLK